jgi:hypothetical protein
VRTNAITGELGTLVHLLPSVLDLFLHRFFDEFWFGWLAPVLVIWYYSTRIVLQKQADNLNSEQHYEPV